MSIKAILQKQAAAVKANSNKITEAQRLEAAAAKLRAEANAPAKISFKEIHRARQSKTAGFFKAMMKGKTQTAAQVLARYGWIKEIDKQHEQWSQWVNQNMPGYKLIMQGNKFSVKFHTELKHPETDLKYIGSYCEANKLTQGRASNQKPVTTFKSETKKQTPAEALKRIKAVFESVNIK